MFPRHLVDGMTGAPSLTGKVLVLEDDPGIRRLERAHLERAGHRVEIAGDIAEARAHLEAGGFELLLLDYKLAEGENGLEFYRALQREGRDLPAILVTGFSEEERVLEAMRAGVRDFIPKTPNFVELVAPTVERVLAQVRGERRLIEAEAAGRAKDNFLAALSHELRTPLTPVLAIVSELRTDDRLPPDLLEDIATIHRNITLEARLIDDLLDLTRIVRGKLELRLDTFDLRPVIEHALKTCSAVDAAAKRIACLPDFAAEPLHVRGDSARLTQVFWNLIKNGIKFTPDGGEVRVRARCETRAGRDWICVEVRDNGIGIEAAALPRIFGAFEQADRDITRRFGGLGLGLAISRAIIDLHGGALSAASEGAGRGSTFSLSLPACAAEEKPTPAPRQPPANDPAWLALAGAHLLLVEDHADTARIMGRILRRAGFHITTAASVAEALARLEEARTAVDATGRVRPVQLLVSDLGLPDGTGADLMRQVRESHLLPGIALSGFGMEEDVRRAHEAGFSRHLTKPVDFENLLGAIREVLAEG